MSGTQNFVVGFIPSNWDTERERVCVGDPNGSGTVEVFFQFCDGKILLPDSSISMDSTIWKPTSMLWKEIAASLQRHLLIDSPFLNSTGLGRAYQIFTEEDDDYTGLILVAGPEDGGEFRNDDGKLSGKFYVKYEYEEDGQYFEERILVIL